MRNFKYLVALVLWTYFAVKSVATACRIVAQLVLENRKQITK